MIRRKPLKKKSDSPVAMCKDRIQALARQIVIARDGGCILRQYPEAGECGGYKKDGELILQAEHLNTRAASVSFGDTRLIICLCKRHHFYFKPQHSRVYWEIVERSIGPERYELLKRVQADTKAHPMGLWDWTKVEIALKQELSTYADLQDTERSL